VEELTDDAGVEDPLDGQVDELHRSQAAVPGHHGVHPGTPLTVHDRSLIGNDRLDEDGVQDTQEQACRVQASQHIVDGRLRCEIVTQLPASFRWTLTVQKLT